MLSLRPKRTFATLAAIVGVLAVAGPAGASSTSHHPGTPGIVTDNKHPDALAFSGDAYVNEMGITARSADGIIAVLIGL
jgi:hypothetical protein